MKLKFSALALFVFTAVSVTNAQISDVPPKHSLGLGPIAGYNLETEGLTYGAGLLYEFRPFQKFGFTAALTYERSSTDVSDRYYGDIEGTPLYGDVWTHQTYSFNVGARYYMNRFYLGGALGVGLDKGHTAVSDGTTFDGGHAYGLYKSLSAGYQLPLKNRDAIEFEAGFFGARNMTIGGTVRYKFGK